MGCSQTKSASEFDWQGHRGARGLAPENTLPAFQKALELGVQTLELDLAVSADGQLVVSHEPWFSEVISTHPDGTPVLETEAQSLALYRMPYDSIKRYDVGMRPHPDFPEQALQPAVKPLFSAVVQMADAFAKANNRDLPKYNIEIKTRPNWDGKFTPPVAEFAEKVVASIQELGIAERTTVQSFDTRALEAIHQLAPQQSTAFLVMNTKGIAYNLKLLTFKPAIYSPYYKILTKIAIDSLHEQEIAVIPWTVNESIDMQILINNGVDGIITDYPNRK